MGLPGLPAHRKSIRNKAKREGWLGRPRSGRGGGWEYHFSALPQETQGYLYAQELVTDPGDNKEDEPRGALPSRVVIEITIRFEAR